MLRCRTVSGWVPTEQEKGTSCVVSMEGEDVLKRRVGTRVHIPAGKVVRMRSWGRITLVLGGANSSGLLVVVK